jgi:hypothetical protein
VYTLLLFTRFGDLEELNRRTELPPWLILDGNSRRGSSFTAALAAAVKYGWARPPIFVAADRSAEAIGYSVRRSP